MDEHATAYEVILRRHEVAEFISANVQVFKRAFASLDDLALTVRDHDPQLMEFINSLADLLRGCLAERHGVDVTPTSDIGPYEPVDMIHTLRILTQLIGNESFIGISDNMMSERDRLELFEHVASIEEGLLAIEEDLLDTRIPNDSKALSYVKQSISKLRASGLLARRTSGLTSQTDLPSG